MMNELRIPIVFSLLLMAWPVNANKVEDVKLYADGAGGIEVYSTNGKAWTNVNNSKAITFKATAYSTCKYMGNVTGSPVDGEMYVWGFHRLTNLGTKKTYSSPVSGTYRYENAKPNPVNICNDELVRRAGQNADKRYKLLSEGFNVDYEGAYKATYVLICQPTGLGFADVGEATAYLNAFVMCKGTPDAKKEIVAKVARLELGPLVTAATFAANPGKYTGECPKGVAFKGSISASRAGEVKYQYIGNDGKKSPEFTLKFAKAGSKPTGNWNRTISPSKGGADQIAAAGDGNNTYNGWQQLRIVSPDPMTKQAKFSVTCGEAPPARATKSAVSPEIASKPTRSKEKK